jgi:hypothetical protein
MKMYLLSWGVRRNVFIISIWRGFVQRACLRLVFGKIRCELEFSPCKDMVLPSGAGWVAANRMIFSGRHVSLASRSMLF